MICERILLQTLLGPGGQEKLRGIAQALRQGALIIYPTETIYGIGGLCGVAGVRERILSAKNRPPDNPLIIVAAARAHLQKMFLRFPAPAERLARTFWPGMLTLVLPSSDGPHGTAVRISPHPFVQALFAYIDAPIYSTSANMSGVPYANDPDAIFREFSGKIDYMIDGGALPELKASTIVKVADDNSVQVVREGVIPAARIFEALQNSG